MWTVVECLPPWQEVDEMSSTTGRLRSPLAELGDGGIERWIAYPAVLWLAVYGGSLMATPESAPETSETSPAAVPATR
jgi:hypothetical protein